MTWETGGGELTRVGFDLLPQARELLFVLRIEIGERHRIQWRSAAQFSGEQQVLIGK
jgi:hypothetical protein